MPYSWFIAQGGTSKPILTCMGKDHSKVKFASCVKSMIKAAGGKDVTVAFAGNGKYAYILFEWSDPAVRDQLIFELGAEQVVDLQAPAELDALIEKFA
jgi:hypothetical protein